MLSAIALSEAPLDADAATALDQLGIDSVGMIDLVYELERRFSLTLHDTDVTAANFATIQSLVHLVKSKWAA